MIVIYVSNKDAVVEFGNAPAVGDSSEVGAIASLEFYKGELEIVCLAMTEPLTHEEGETFNVQITPDRSIISYGMSMIGQAPIGRLDDYEPTGNGDGMRPVPTDWCVDLVDTCKPMIEGIYKAVHICHCVRVSLPVAA